MGLRQYRLCSRPALGARSQHDVHRFDSARPLVELFTVARSWDDLAPEVGKEERGILTLIEWLG